MSSGVKSLMCNAVAVCGLTLLVLVSGCGGGGTSTPAVTPTLKSIAVTGGSSVNVGDTDPFTATGIFTDGTNRNLTTSLTWSSSTPANATISGAGLATGVHSGTTMITAKDNATGITSPAVTLTVVAVLSSIAISPMPAVNIAPGGTENFSALATFNDATTQATFTTSCAWTSSNPVAVTIGASSGVAMAPNNAAIGATSNISCSATIPAGTSSVTSNTVVATITTTALLAITTASLPNAIVGAAYDQPILTSGGDGSAITFALANSTTLPAWANLNTSTGHITGTPAAGDVGTSAPFQISATQSGNTLTSGNLTLTVLASINAELNGSYAFLLRGFVGNAITIGGSFIADGAGKITGGVMDINGASPSPQIDLTITAGFYSVGTDNRGQLTLSTSSGAQSFDFSLGSISAGVASLGHIISRQATLSTVGSAISGVFKKQNTSAFNLTNSTGIGGDFAFLSEGADSGRNRVATAGRLTINTNASLSNGAIDINDNGSFDNGVPGTPGLGPLPFTGSVDSTGVIDPVTGRGTMTLNLAPPSGPTLHQAFYVVSGGEMLILSTDPVDATHNLYSSSALRQSATFCPTSGACAFTNNALNGSAVVRIQSNSGPSSNPSCSLAVASSVQVGALTFAPATTSFSGGFDANDCGTIATPSTGGTTSGTYTVAPNGRVTLTGGLHSPFFYMVDTNQGFLIGTNGGSVEAGVGEPQAAPPFKVFSGGRAFGAESPAVSRSLVYSGVETVTAGTPNSITQIRQDQNAIQGGLRENVSLLIETFTIDATTGRMTFGSGMKVGYFINSNRTVVIDVQSTDTTPTISISDNQ